MAETPTWDSIGQKAISELTKKAQAGATWKDIGDKIGLQGDRTHIQLKFKTEVNPFTDDLNVAIERIAEEENMDPRYVIHLLNS